MPSTRRDSIETVLVPPPLGADEIHVYLYTMAPDARGRAITEAARGVLDRLLCAHTGRMQAPAVLEGPHGKPYAPDADGIEFNLSHCGNHVVLAMARGQAVGVDIERLRPRPSAMALARRFFAADEADALERMSEAVRAVAFMHLWTHKEAVLKSLGDGLQFGLDRLAFSVDAEGKVKRFLRIAEGGGPVDSWRLHRLSMVRNVVGVLAWRDVDRSVRLFRLAEPG